MCVLLHNHYVVARSGRHGLKPHTYTYHIIIIIITAMSTLCYSIISHTTLILYYHTSMFTLPTSFISCAILIASGVILEKFECNDLPQRAFGFKESLFCGPFTRLGYVSHIIMHPKVQSLPFGGHSKGWSSMMSRPKVALAPFVLTPGGSLLVRFSTFFRLRRFGCPLHSLTPGGWNCHGTKGHFTHETESPCDHYTPKRVIKLGPLHTRAKSRDHEIVRAQKKSVQMLSQDTSKIMYSGHGPSSVS